MSQNQLKDDLKALEMVRLVLVKLATTLLQELGVFDTIKTPKSLEYISTKCNIKNKKMLENMLDILVGYGILAYTQKGYLLIEMKNLNIKPAEDFLKKNYKESLEWIYFVNQFSSTTLTKNKPTELTGFEEEKAIYYWNKIMEQSPHSLRVLAITELYRNLNPGSLVLDYGCGGGVGLQQLIELSNKPIQLVGTDPSTKFFLEAQSRIGKLNFYDSTKNINKENIKFEDFKNLNKYTGRFDAIFISIIFNHIYERDHIKVFKKLRKLLKPGGKLAIVQLLDFSKYNRNPIWVMHNIPSHKGYPLRDNFVSGLKNTFPKVDIYLDGMVTISTK